MKRTMKSLLVILISWIVVSSFTSFKEVSAATSINYNSKVSAFTSNSKWKDGVTWSEKQEPRSEPLSSNWPSQGCLAYACDFVKEVFGHSSYKANATYFTDVSKIQAGDVIHYSNHYFVVLSRSGNKLKTAEGSYALKTGGRKQVSISSSRYSIVSKNGKYYLYKSDTKTYCTSNFYGYHHQTLATSVTLNKSTASLNAGSTVKLSAAVLPKAASASVTWKSSDTSIATVSSSGVVKGIKAGTVTITCKTNDTSDKSVTCKVTVKSAAKVKVTGVSLNKTSLPVIKGYTAQLTAKISPDSATNKSVTWSSSNTKVATVSSSGLVKGIKAGTAVITCTTKDGSKKATCKVTVKTSANINVTGVSLNKTSASVDTGATVQLTATISPDNATNKSVTWSSSNTKIATVSSSGLVKGIKAGSATITCVTKDGSKKATCKITVTNASTLSITNVSAPSGTLAAGSAFTIAGQITSNYTITSITAKVETSSGTSKFSNTVKPNSKSYPVYNLDSKMNFSKLAAGKYVFTITATDLKGTKTLVSKSFTVKAASFTTSGITYPSSISKGKDFTIKGTVKSTSKITNISVSIINTTTGKQMSGGSVNPKATSYNVNKLDSKLNFKSLEKGKYVYRLSATNASGITKYIVTKSFTVK